MERFAKIANDSNLLTIFAKRSILDVLQGSSEYVTVSAENKFINPFRAI